MNNLIQRYELIGSSYTIDARYSLMLTSLVNYARPELVCSDMQPHHKKKISLLFIQVFASTFRQFLKIFHCDIILLNCVYIRPHV